MFGILSRVSISAVFLYFFQCFLQLFSVLASVSQATARVLNNSMLLFRGTMRLSFFQNVDSSLVSPSHADAVQVHEIQHSYTVRQPEDRQRDALGWRLAGRNAYFYLFFIYKSILCPLELAKWP
nr:uncharacterized protein LOC120963022 [Aegilops tauschii subsp. strangulata]